MPHRQASAAHEIAPKVKDSKLTITASSAAPFLPAIVAPPLSRVSALGASDASRLAARVGWCSTVNLCIHVPAAALSYTTMLRYAGPSGAELRGLHLLRNVHTPALRSRRVSMPYHPPPVAPPAESFRSCTWSARTHTNQISNVYLMFRFANLVSLGLFGSRVDEFTTQTQHVNFIKVGQLE